MELSDLELKTFDTKNGNNEHDENTNSDARADTEEIKKEEECNYETLKKEEEHNYESLSTDQLENTRKRIQWEDILYRMKYTLYFISSLVILLYIGVIAMAVIIAQPKTQDGEWSVWGSWGTCTDTCGGGVCIRSRSCTNPSPSLTGRPCTGDSSDVSSCNRKPCTDGEWSVWGSWGSCTDTCGGGVRIRSRSCTNPNPSLTGRPCTGDSSDVSSCSRKPCTDYNVAFTATSMNTSGTTKSALQFFSVHLNNGDAYSSKTGKFTCKIPGVYYFAATLTKASNDVHYLDVKLRINNSSKLYMHFHPHNDDSNERVSFPLTTSGTFHLNTNDTVDVYGIPNYFHSGYFSSFTGILVTPDQ